MRINKYLHNFYGAVLFRLLWCLIATTLTNTFIAHAADTEEIYDSSLQRSNFLSMDPIYEKTLKDQMKDRRSAFIWKLRFDSENLSTDDNIQSQSVGATVRTKFKYKLVDGLNFKAKANLGLESGRSQSIFGDLEPRSGIYPREIKLEFKPLGNYLTIDAGQINQRWVNESLFVGNLGFPGISEQVRLKKKSFEVSARAQQLIPTSSTLSTRVTEKEQTPTLFTESVDATLRLSSQNFMKGRVLHYSYNHLPSVVAYDSFIYGNTVNAPDINNAEFVYKFDGFLTNLTFEQKISDSLSAQVQWNTIRNNSAPSTNGEAQSINIWLSNDFGRWIVTGMYKNYFIESDAVPAAYNSHRLGHNNRIGNAYGLNVESKDWGIIFKGYYTKADLLNPTVQRIDGLQQDNQQTFYFAVETMYDFI